MGVGVVLWLLEACGGRVLVGGAFQRADVRQKLSCLGEAWSGSEAALWAGEGRVVSTAGNRRNFPSRRGVTVYSDLKRLMLPWVYFLPMGGREVRFLRARGLTGSGEGVAALEFLTAPSWTSLPYDVTVVSTHPDKVCV